MNYITFFTDFLDDHFYDLTDEEVGKITRAALWYLNTGEEPAYEKRSVLALTWRRIKLHIEQSKTKAERNRVNGSKTKQTEATASEVERPEANRSEKDHEQEQDQEQDQDQDHEYDQDQDQDHGQKKPHNGKRSRTARFVPPTVEEVRAYCQERGNNVDPQRFVDYYESVGWMVGNKPMKDFKAGVRTWERNDFSGGKRDSPKESGVGFGEILRQREYDDDYFASLEVDLTK